MIDGLALGETTPGPLVRAVAFVGVILNLAVFFAYHMEYGAKAAAYVDAFMENIYYGNAGIRLEHATRVHA
jgi:hypothetical protein